MLLLSACWPAEEDEYLCHCTLLFPDAGPDAAPPYDCDPVAQTGCELDEKCASVTISDGIDRTMCVPDGDVPLGGECTAGAPGPDTGYDDCVAGYHCSDGVCKQVCDLETDSCSDGEHCVSYGEFHTGFGDAGMCNLACDVLAQDCAQLADHTHGTGCYISLENGNQTCAPARPEVEDGLPGVQGEACMYLNTCAVGSGCTQLDHPVNTTTNVCAFFCDAAASGGPTCADGPGPQYSCVAINEFYDDAINVPDEVGFCVDCALWTDVPGCQ
jgi:hypothetical protein